MAAPAHPSASHARSPGLAAAWGRHAGPGPQRCTAVGGSGKPRSAPLRAAVGYDGRGPAAPSRPLGMAPGSLLSRPPASAAQLAQLQRAAAPTQPQQAAAPAQQAAAELAPPPSELELRRRKKISEANKGRTPWNKGRRHPPETIARIKAATKVAMQRPDVKQRLAEANEKREPHTDEAKAKIRVKLLHRAEQAREQIDAQAAIIVERLRSSDDPAIRQCGEYEQAQQVVAGLAWQYFKKDWEEVASRGWDEHPDFRTRVEAKLGLLVSKKRSQVVKKRRPGDKVRKALEILKKARLAREKIADGEAALARLQQAKEAFASDPARMKSALAAEEKVADAIERLRQQLAALDRALQPLLQYLGEDAVQPGPGQGEPRLVWSERLDELHQRATSLVRAEREAANAAAAEEVPPTGERQPEAAAAAVNGRAAPQRSSMPWQQ